jgi:TonB family protein
MLAAPVVTFLSIQPFPPAQPTVLALGVSQNEGLSTITTEVASAPAAPRRISSGVLSALVVFWGFGVLVLSSRLVGGWLLVRGLVRRAARCPNARLEMLAASLGRRLGVHRVVRVVESSAVTVPVVVGWLKPVVLFPAAAVTQLPVAQVEALLVHELAHIRRQDYLVNLLQSAVETLLFYHPAVWWMSRRVRAEREQCCDDLAVSICDRLVYVNALVGLAERTAHARLALAATDGPLCSRVRRLLGQEDRRRPRTSWLGASIALLFVAGVVQAAAAVIGDPEQRPALDLPAVAPVTLEMTAAPTDAIAITADSLELVQPVDRATPAHSSSPVPQQKVYRIGGELRPPTLLKRVEPAYADEAKAANMSGPVYVEATIARDGSVRNAVAVGGVRFQPLRDAAIAAVSQWMYTPTLLNGEPIEVQLSVQVNFRMTESPLAAARRLLDEARGRYSPSHPDVMRLEALVRQMEAQAAGTSPDGSGATINRLSDPQETVQAGDVLHPDLGRKWSASPLPGRVGHRDDQVSAARKPAGCRPDRGTSARPPGCVALATETRARIARDCRDYQSELTVRRRARRPPRAFNAGATRAGARPIHVPRGPSR